MTMPMAGGPPHRSRPAAPADAVRTTGDCDDTSPDVHPGAVERCNGIDDDCDGLVDDADDAPSEPLPWYRDADGDGYGDPLHVVAACLAPTGYVAVGIEDCDDTDAERAPDAVERCLNGTDDDCDGIVDEQCAQLLDGADATLDGTAGWDMLGSSVGSATGTEWHRRFRGGRGFRRSGAAPATSTCTASQLLPVAPSAAHRASGSPFDLLGYTLSLST